MAIGKVLFPPIVPNSLPAFDKNTDLKYYFKPSIANTLAQIKHIQVSIVFLDTNISALNKNDYLFEIMFIPISSVAYDESKGFYYFTIPKTIYANKGDLIYKIQIRLGETELIIDQSGVVTNASTILKDLDKMSEWSIVTLALPITVPNYGVQSFSDTEENRIASTGFTFSGYYEAKDPDKKETLTSYRYNIYSYGNEADKTTWKLLSTSGEKLIGMETKINMDFVFPIELKEKAHYIVTLSIKTKNLYSSTKIYKVYSASYPVLEQFNSIIATPNSDEGKIELTVNAKQILLKEESDTTVTYFKEVPPGSNYDSLKGTHAKIQGTVDSDKNFFLMNIDGKWVLQTKVRFEHLYEKIEDFSKNPTIVVENIPYLDNSNYYAKIKVGALKINTAYSTPSVIIPTPVWSYRIIVRKEIYQMENNREKLILSQKEVVRLSSEITPQKEYYIYLKEDNGYFDLKILE